MKELIKRKLRSIIRDIVSDSENLTVKKSNNPFKINFQDEVSHISKPLEINGGPNITIGLNSRVGRNAWLGAIENYAGQDFTPKITIGSNVNIGNYACITAINEVSIGDGCLLSEYVYISDHSHGLNPKAGISPAIQGLESKGNIKIGENSFLGMRVCILPGVELGKFCVVGANAVVTRSFSDYSMLAGVPAKCIKKFDFNYNEWIAVNEAEV